MPGNAPENPGLVKSLSLNALIVYGIGDMLGAGIYGLIGVAAGLLGTMVWAGFLLSALAACLTALSYACLGSRYPKAGGAAYVAERAFGIPALAYFMGLAVMASGLISMAAASRAFVSYAVTITDIFSAPLLIAFFVSLLGIINFLGMRQSSWMNALCTVIELSGLLFIIAIGFSYWGSVDLFELPGSKPFSWSDSAVILQGAVLTFYAFLGFEDLLNVAEEVKDPEKNFAPGILLALLATFLIYTAVAVSAVSVVPYQELGSSKSGPLVLVAAKAAPWFDAKIFGFIAVFAIANTALLNYVMASRLAFGMARQGLLPEVFSRLHAARGTPHVAIVAIFAIVTGLALSGDISQLASATSILLLTVFIGMNSALLVLKRRRDEPRGPFEVPAFVPVAAIAINLALLIARAFGEDVKPFYLAGVLLGCIALLYGLSRLGKT